MSTPSHTGKKIALGLFGMFMLGVVIVVSAYVWLYLYPLSHAIALSGSNGHVLQVTGVVISTDIEEVSRSNDRTDWNPVVTYSYTVAGTAYTSRIWRISSPSAQNRAEAERIAGSYEPGQAVNVYYNPRNPGWATLDRGYRTWEMYGLVIMLIIIVPFIIVMGPAYTEGRMRKEHQQWLIGSLLEHQPEPPRTLPLGNLLPAFYNPWFHLPSVAVAAGSMWAALQPLVITTDAWLFFSIGALSVTAAIALPLYRLGALLWGLRNGYVGDAVITAYTLHRNRYGRYAKVTWDVESAAGQFSGRFTISYRNEWTLREGSRVRVLVHPNRPKVLRIIGM